jgi:hypothetical protein
MQSRDKGRRKEGKQAGSLNPKSSISGSDTYTHKAPAYRIIPQNFQILPVKRFRPHRRPPALDFLPLKAVPLIEVRLCLGLSHGARTLPSKGYLSPKLRQLFLRCRKHLQL